MILDGAMGTELDARGVPTPAALWGVQALLGAPAVVVAIHRESGSRTARVVRRGA